MSYYLECIFWSRQSSKGGNDILAYDEKAACSKNFGNHGTETCLSQ